MKTLLDRSQVALDSAAMLPQVPREDLQTLVGIVRAALDLATAIMLRPPSAYSTEVSDALLALMEAGPGPCACPQCGEVIEIRESVGHEVTSPGGSA